MLIKKPLWHGALDMMMDWLDAMQISSGITMSPLLWQVYIWVLQDRRQEVCNSDPESQEAF